MLTRKLYYYRKLSNTQYYEPEEIEKLQRSLLKKTLRHAYENNEFYREKWDESGFHPGEVEELEDVEKVPYTGREEITDNYPSPIMTDETIYSRSTSGSSGRDPLEVAWNEQAFDFSEAVYLRSLVEQGYSPLEKKAYYWYKDFDQKFYNKLFMRKERVSSELSREEQLEKLEDLDLDTWYYYGGILYSLAKKALAEDEWDLDPDLIITHAEIMTEGMKKTIKEAFDAEVHDQYGTTEFNRMAWECEEGNYHLDSESILCEFEETELGKELVCTSLIKRGMPMIRYRMGDIIEPKEGECDCGRGLSMIEPPEGRKANFIKDESPRQIIKSVDRIKGLETFQIRFDGEKVDLLYTETASFKETHLEEAVENLEELLETEVDSVEREEIPRTDGGKRPMVVNETT